MFIKTTAPPLSASFMMIESSIERDLMASLSFVLMLCLVFGVLSDASGKLSMFFTNVSSA